MNRRRALGTIAGGTTFGLAGCLSFLDGGTELGGVEVVNMAVERLTVEVRVTLDGEVVADSSEELAGDEYTTLDCTWPAEQGNFAVAGRFESADEWQERDVGEVDGDCARAVVIVHHSGDHVEVLLSHRCDRRRTC